MKNILGPAILIMGLLGQALPARADFITTTTLSGATELAGTGSSGTGTLTLQYNSSLQQLNYNLVFSGLSSSATIAQLHYGTPGQTGAVLFTLFNLGMPPNQSLTAGAFSGTLTRLNLETDTTDGINSFTDAINAIATDKTYVNVQTVGDPNGEIRGNLLPNPEPASVGLVGGSFLLAGMGLLRRRSNSSH